MNRADFPKMLKQMDQILILILHSKSKFVWEKSIFGPYVCIMCHCIYKV